MQLYEIAQTFIYVLEQAELGEIPEEAVGDTLDAIEGDFAYKADQLGCMVKNLDAEIAALKAEEKALQERRRSKETHCDRLKEYLRRAMKMMGMKKLETPSMRVLLTIRKSPAAVKIDNMDTFVEWAKEHADDLLIYRQPEPNKTKIKEYLSSGHEIAGVRMEQGETLQIK